MPELEGHVEPGFEPVRDAFARCFAELGETGAQTVAIAGGRVVADLWGGALRADSLVCVYSVSKPLAAVCVMALVDRGALGLDDDVAAVWPSYARAGKAGTTVRHVLSHQAGVPGFRQPAELGDLLDWDRAIARIEAEPAWWPPGTEHGEHALLFGHLCGELVRRVDGRSLGAFFAEEVARPWGLDAHIGVPPELDGRVVDLEDPGGAFAAASLRGAGDDYRLAVDNPPSLRRMDIVNSVAWRRAEIPAVNAFASARGVARFYAGLLAGGELDAARVLSGGAVAAMTTPQASGPDRLLGKPATWGLGLAYDDDDGGWGMGGLGGSLGWMDPDRGSAVAYVTRHMGDHDRALAVETALRAALARAG